MLGKDARRCKRQRDLREFIERFCPELDRTRVKFFRQSLWGILLSGSLVVSRWVRWIGDRCRLPFYRQRRLLNQLASRDWDYQQVLARYQQAWARRIEADTTLIIDLCDLKRPRARRMKYIDLVRDGSDDGRLVSGYWCLEIYAYWGKGRLTPMVLHPYSLQDPLALSENQRILEGVAQVMQATEGRGVLVMDRGGDRRRLLIPWIQQRWRFVVRQKGDRHLRLPNGVCVRADHLAEQLLQRSGGRTAFATVTLPELPAEPLSLVCKRLRGSDRPLILLSNLRVIDLPTARGVLVYYRRRWKCEEAARFLKMQLGLERWALRTYETFGPLMLMASVAMGFLTWMQLHYASLARWLAQAAPGRRKIKFAYYRLLEWLMRQILPAPPNVAPP